MNWNLIFAKLYPIAVGMASIFISYYGAYSSIRQQRKLKTQMASVWGKTWSYLCTIGTCAAVSLFFSYDTKDQLSYFVVWMAITGLPASIGVMAYFDKDDKMTILDRVKLKRKMDEEDMAAKNYPEY